MFEKYRLERWKEVYAPNPAILRLLMAREGYKVLQWGDQPGIVYAKHKHPEEQSHWVISGALELNVGGEIYVLEAGDRDFLEAETLHTARVASEETVIYLVGEKIK